MWNYLIWFLVVFLIILLVLTVLNYLVTRNYYIYNFLINYKKDRDIFFNENVENLTKNEPNRKINMSKFEADSKEARDYLKEIGVRDYYYNVEHFGGISRASLLENLGTFPDVNTLSEEQALPFMKDLFFRGQSLIDEGIHLYKKRSIRRFSPTYWINKNKRNENSKVITDSIKKKSAIVTFISSFLLSLVINIIGNILTNLI
ncbi:hypothetical protein JGU63_14775, partial [Staphylococcus aureus]|nr:hypothetical protein [Staphylococcus aureus]